MKVLYVLDTTVLIDHLRGRPVTERVRGLLTRGITPATTAINVEEIVRGMRPAERKPVQLLFSGLVVLPVTTESAWQAGQWRREYAERGITLGQADCLIAAAAARESAPVVTGNPKDFPMNEVDVLHWPVGK